MSWTANVITVIPHSNGLVFDCFIDFTDGTTTHSNVPFRVPNPETLKQMARNQIAAYEAAALVVIPKGELDISPPPPPDPPTQDELDRAEFAAICETYRVAKAEVEAGVGKSTQQTLDGLVVEIKTAYKDEYAPFLVGLF